MTKQDKVAKVMHEWKAGTLTSNGKQVTDYDQAVAIALSEAGLSKYARGGWVLYDEDDERLIKVYETESEARKNLYEYEGNANIVEKSSWDNNHYAEGGGIEDADDFIENVKEMHESIDYVVLKDGTKVNGYDLMEKGGDMNEYSKGGNIIERRYVNKDQDYETRYAKDKPSRMGYKDERKFAVGGGVGEKNNLPSDLVIAKHYGENYSKLKKYQMDALRLAYKKDVLKPLESELENNKSAKEEEIKIRLSKEYDNLVKYKSPDYIAEEYDLDERDGRSDSEMKEEWIQAKFRIYPYKFAVGGEVGNTVSFKGDYGTPRSGVVKEKRGSSYIVSTDDGDRLVDSYEVISFSETPIAKKKRFGFFEGGGEIQSKIEKLKKVVSSKMINETARERARILLAELEKELHESKETKAEEKEEHKTGGYEYGYVVWEDGTHRIISKHPTLAGAEKYAKELADKNKGEIYHFGSTEKYERFKAEEGKSEYESKLDEKEELNSTIQKLYGIESKAEDLINYQSGGIQGQSVDKIKKYVEYVNKEVSKLNVPFGSEVFEVLEDENAHSLNLTLGLLGFYKNERDSGEWAKKYEQYAKVIEVVNEIKGGGKSEAKKPTTRKATTRKAPVRKAVVKKVVKGDLPKSKFEIGDKIGVSGHNEVYEIKDKSYRNNIEGELTWVYYLPEYSSVLVSEKNLKVIPKPKADHKKLVAKLKAKKGGKEYSNRASLVPFTETRRKRNESSDRKREALPLGKRVSESGRTYYETRLNRGDISKEDKFEDGGEVKGSDWGLNLNW